MDRNELRNSEKEWRSTDHRMPVTKTRRTKPRWSLKVGTVLNILMAVLLIALLYGLWVTNPARTDFCKSVNNDSYLCVD